MRIFTADDECPVEDVQFKVTLRPTAIGQYEGAETVSTHESYQAAQDAIDKICDEDTTAREWMYLIRQTAGFRTERISEGATLRFNGGLKEASPNPTRAEVMGMRIGDDGETLVKYRYQESCGGDEYSMEYRDICRRIASGSIEVIDRRGDFEGYHPMRASLGGPGRGTSST